MHKTTELLSRGAAADWSVDQIEFTTPGTYSWTVLPGITSVSMVGVQGGQGGASAGGDGGKLRYINNVSVTPGEKLTIVVGVGGAPAVFVTDSAATKGSIGGHSSVSRGTTALLSTSETMGIGYTGGIGGQGSGLGTASCGGGGGGAAGYVGNGGNGSSGSGTTSTNGQGGGGGGGGRATTFRQAEGVWIGIEGSNGGGVGIKGQGASGSGGADKTTAEDISQAPAGRPGSGTAEVYGGGGGGGRVIISTIDGARYPGLGASGGNGAVRIIWPGTIRQFPSTRTADE